MSLVGWLVGLTFTTLCRGRSTAVVPPYYRTGTTHYYTFWKAVSSRLVPTTLFLQISVRNLTLDYCSQQKATGLPCLDAAKTIYDGIAFPSFPSNKTLQKERKTSQRPFMKSLLKETFNELQGYGRLLDADFNKHCQESKHQLSASTCDQLKLISLKVKQLAAELKKQLRDYFNAYFLKIPKRSVVEKTLGKFHRPKFIKSFALLYALYTHLHETQSALQFSLEFTKPGFT